MEVDGFEVVHEIKAGRLVKDSSTLRADPRKGLIRVVKRSDGLVSFQWRERSATQPDVLPETDILMFPQDATFIKVPNSSSRSYMLKFAEAERDLFFWMQEPKAENDTVQAESISESINSFSPGDEEGEDDEDQAMEAVESIPAAVTSDPGPGQTTEQQAGIQAAQLAAALRGIGMPTSMQQGESDVAQVLAAMQQRRDQPPGPSLSEVLKPELLLPIFQDPSILQTLAEHLPEGQQTQQDLEKLATSSQFRHQLDAFSSALRSGQLDLAHFGMEGQGFSVLDFLNGIQKHFSKPDASGK